MKESLPEAALATPPSRSLSRALWDFGNCLYLQLYFWGRDVLHPCGNQLVAHGFQRVPKTTLRGTSRYRLPYQDGIIELHGWCAGWYRLRGRGFVFVRNRRRLFLCDKGGPVNPTHPEECRLRAPATDTDWRELAGLAQDFARWLLHYEASMRRRWGEDCRDSPYAEYSRLPKAMRLLPPDLRQEWLHSFCAGPESTLPASRFLKEELRRWKRKPGLTKTLGQGGSRAFEPREMPVSNDSAQLCPSS